MQHNDANVCVLGVDCLGIKLCSQLALHYLTSEFDHEERNMLRVAMLMDFEKTDPTPLNS
jgi:ribose 5-phosphate isomerase RpiB